MIKLKQVAVAALLIAGSAAAQAAALVSLTITGGDFAIGSPGVGACIDSQKYVSTFSCVAGGPANTITMGSYGGGVGNSITTFYFLAGDKVETFTAASAAGVANSYSGNPPNGTVTGSTISVDLGGFYTNMYGVNQLQGTDPSGTSYNVNGNTVSSSLAATGTWTPTGANTGTFDISWQSAFLTAPFTGQIGYWHLTGTGVTAVPVPAAVWLLGSGLVGLFGLARHHKSVL